MHPLETAVPGAGRQEAGLCSLLLPPGCYAPQGFCHSQKSGAGLGLLEPGDRLVADGQPGAA